MNNCDHEEIEEYEVKYRDCEGDICVETERRFVSTFKDIDLHRYQCSRCGEIGYYSGAAKDFYEQGKTCAVKGLH